MLALVKSHLRGALYDEHALLTELRFVDKIVATQCPPLGKITRKYGSKITRGYDSKVTGEHIGLR